MANPRKEILTTNEIYHIYNQSIGNEEIFSSKSAVSVFLKCISFYSKTQTISFSKFKSLNIELQQSYLKSHSNKRLVEIYAFSIMPNHYHLVLKQLVDKGTSSFISKVQNSFAKTYNKTYKRKGGVFIRPFKSKRVETNEQLIHLIRYVVLNPVTAFLIKIEDLENSYNTSFIHDLRNFRYDFVDGDLIQTFFNDIDDYKKFIYDQSDYQQQLGVIKRLTLEKA